MCAQAGCGCMALILVIEDDDGIRALLSTVLMGRGYRVSLAEHGQAALQAIAQRRPDLILLDLAMPVMDGRTFLRAYEAQAGPHIPVIVLSVSGGVAYDRYPLHHIDAFLVQ